MGGDEIPTTTARQPPSNPSCGMEMKWPKILNHRIDPFPQILSRHAKLASGMQRLQRDTDQVPSVASESQVPEMVFPSALTSPL